MIRICASILAALLGSLLVGSAALAQGTDAARGKELHDAHCTACHTSLMNGDKTAIFTRPKRIVRSFDGLQKRVRFCETANGMDWNDEQIEDVVAYLNAAFYKFK